MTFVYPQDKTDYVADPNGTNPPLRYTRSVFTYDAAYGNLLLTRLYSEAAPTIPYRTIKRVYSPRNDGTTYIVNRVAEEKLFAERKRDMPGADAHHLRQLQRLCGVQPGADGWAGERGVAGGTGGKRL
ncbi:hypothetical protein [Candidatus Amarobacter glycogenicus]|uniref:hypothetical protein n=1 Tax=Candidatus Amarobacter glycogenicus TaxID=3140699 RepID=UPI0031348B66|nr:hypothetical protein [Dehalococcoidia bacterium]